MNPHEIPPFSSFTGLRKICVGSGLILALAAPVLLRAAGPLIQYNFDEGTGTTAANSGSLGTGSNLTLDTTGSHVGWSTDTPGGTGASLTMDGTSKNSYTSAYVYGDGTALNTNLTAFTITAWVNLTTIGAGDRLVGFAYGASGFDFRLNAISGETASFSLDVNNTLKNSTASADVVGQWTFLAVTYDGANAYFYSGNTSVGATALGGGVADVAGAVATVSNATTALRVGSSGSTNTDRTPAGSFDDVRIYGSALGASAIEAVRASAISSIPEPSSAALLFAGASLVASVAVRRRRR